MINSGKRDKWGKRMLSRVSLAWRLTDTGLVRLRIDDRITTGGGPRSWSSVVDTPVLVVDSLVEPDGPGLTVDPAADLIRAESRWRLRAAQLEDTTDQLRRAATTVLADLLALPDHPGLLPGLLTRGERRELSTVFQHAVHDLATTIRVLTVARHRVRAVRDFVIALDLPDGLLGGARAGWRRDPARPSFVSSYASEDVFVVADPRRAALPSNGPAGLAGAVRPVAGERYGLSWRRDGDDDDPYTDEPAVIGPWQLGYIPATGEIYASRRCHYRDPRVWLLARGHTDPDRTRLLLSTLKQRHMAEPNSLLHAAQVLHNTADPTVDTPSRARDAGGGDRDVAGF